MLDPHAEIPSVRSGPAASEAEGALILVHGRGGSADDMLGVIPFVGAERFRVVALQARGQSWYPNSFLAPVDQNEPGRTSGLARIERTIDELRAEGFADPSIAIAGFSQGACLALEFVSLNPRSLGAVIGWSGGLIGPLDAPFDRRGSLSGSLKGVPVFLGCSDVDPHIPHARVLETAAVLEAMGAAVDLRIYPGMGHTINRDEIDAARALLNRIGLQGRTASE